MATKQNDHCHKTYKLGRQLSNDHTCQILFTSLHRLFRRCNLTIFPYLVYGSFVLHGTQTRKQSIKILAIFKAPNQATFLPS